MQQPALRAAEATDAPRVVRIYIDSWNAGFGNLMPTRDVTAELVTRWEHDLVASARHHWWVAEVDETLVGFAGIGPSRDPIDPELGELNTIAVAPIWWRKRIGQTLMDVALHQLADDGYREAILWTLTNYERGQLFYEAHGWRLDGGVRDEGRQVRYRHSLTQQGASAAK